ncbi:MAG: c-type cytochrome, partial [Planctomycetota bacterium]
LKDEDPFVRAEAVTSLARLGKSAPVERVQEIAAALREALADSEAPVRHLAMRSLRALGAYAECLKAAESENQAASRSALLALREIYTDEAAAGLLALSARAASPELKAEVVKTMGRLTKKEDTWTGEAWGPQPDTSGPFQRPAAWRSTEKLAGAVKAALADKDERIAGAALWALACMRDGSAVDEIATLFGSGAPALKSPAAKVLLISQPIQAVPFFGRLLADSTRPEEERIRALDILRCLRTPVADRALAEAIARVDAEFRKKEYDKNTGLLPRVRLTLAGLTSNEALPALQALFKAPETSQETRFAVARALFNQRRDIAATAAVALLNSADPAVVAMALNNLPAKGDITAAHLRPFLSNTELSVQAATLTALGRLKDAESAGAMVAHLDNPGLRDAAIEALTLLGPRGSQESIINIVEAIIARIESDKFAGIQAETKALACARAWAASKAVSEESREKLAPRLEGLKEREAKLAQRREQFIAGIMARQGDVAKGAALFNEAPRLGCARCHALNGKGGDAGPDLSSIGALKDKLYVLDAILEPQRDIASGFEPVDVTLHPNKHVYGAMLKRTVERFDLALANGLRDSIARGDVHDLDPTPGSVMPAGLADGLTVEELGDLVEFLMGQKK